MKSHLFNQTIAGLLIFLFAYTAISKLIDYEMFHAQLSIYPFIGNVSWVLTIAIPLAEFVIVVLLMAPSTRVKGFFASIVLLSLFTAYLILMINTNNNLPCSCGGVIGNLSWREHVVLNICFILMATAGCRLEKGNHLNRILPATRGIN